MFEEAPETDRQRLQFNDRVTQGELYKEWKPYKHPLYGDIEIGGWVKTSSRSAPPVHAAGSCSQECIVGNLHRKVHSEGKNGCF